MGSRHTSPRYRPRDNMNESPLSSTEVNDGPRALPERKITSTTAEDNYVQFIFYCNPSIPTSVDATELRRLYNSMPKTDGKTFETWNLYVLIQKLESKELETWHQLVIEMGVSPPDLNSGQSTQKIQQYAVRLKRWLHASHVDAFFQYCLGKSNTYFTEVPPADLGLGASPRDGVVPEDDLVLRNLIPAFRPKRGRRPNEEAPTPTSTKRPLLAAPWIDETPVSALLKTASPWDKGSTPRDLWTAPRQNRTGKASSATPQPTEPRLDGQYSFYMDLEQHPQSATTTRAPMSAFPTSTPQSAHPTMSRRSGKKSKRTGPSVSAAWSTETTAAGKTRGRPPANKTSQDGPYSTFPARQTPPRASTPPIASTHYVNTQLRMSPSQPRKPSKLSLQVPQHAGGPVRLATPPAPNAPRVMINGSGGTRERHERRTSADFFNTDEDPSEMGESEADETAAIGVDWKRRAIALQRRVKTLEAELKTVKRRVLEAVM